MKYGVPRHTKDLDVWVHNSPQDSLRVVGSLKKFVAALEHDGITAESFAEKRGCGIACPGAAPAGRIDVLKRRQLMIPDVRFLKRYAEGSQ